MLTRTKKSQLGLSALGFGAAQGGNLYRVTSDEEFFGALEVAWSAGVRYFDTSPHYGLGLSERRLGEFLATKPRDEFVVSTKVGRLLRGTGEAPTSDLSVGGFAVESSLRREWDLTEAGIQASLEESLARMGLDRVDVLYLHDPDDHEREMYASALPAMERLRDEGVVRAVGLGMNQAEVPAQAIQRHSIDIVMLAGRLTLINHQSADELLRLAHQRGVELVVAGVFNSGMLASARASVGSSYDYGRAPGHLVERVNAIAECCETFGVTLPEAALAFPLRCPAVTSVVVGVRNAAQFAQNLARFEVEVPDQLWVELEDRFQIRSSFTH